MKNKYDKQKNFLQLLTLRLLERENPGLNPTLNLEQPNTIENPKSISKETLKKYTTLRNNLFLENRHLSLNCATNLFDYYKLDQSQISLEELISYSDEALLIAIDKFDPSKSSDFCAYAGYYIKNYCLNNRNRFLGLDDITSHHIVIIEKARKELVSSLGTNPTYNELKNDPELFQELSAKVAAVSPRTLPYLQAIATTSLEDVPTPIAPDSLIQVEDKIDDERTYALVRDILPIFSSLDRKILGMHFNTDSKEPLSYEKISQQIGCSSETVRKKVNKTFYRFRHPSRSIPILKKWL